LGAHGLRCSVPAHPRSSRCVADMKRLTIR